MARRQVGLALLLCVLAAPLTGVAPVTAVTPGNNGKIVFVSNSERQSGDLYTMDGDGGNVTRITHDTPDPTFGLQYLEPAWSPNGAKIAAYRRNPFGDLVTMNADGSGLVPVLVGVTAFAPTWSPDGLTLFYADNMVGNTSPGHIWKVGVNGSGVTQLTTGSNQDGDPAVNPAGTKVAIVRNGAIATINTNGTGYVSLTPGVTNATDPSWSPDGTKIAFARYQDGIWTVKADGTGLVRLGTANWLFDATQPAWSPDGARIAVTRTSGYGPGIDVMNGAASCVSRLFGPASPTDVQQADWQPVATPTLFRFPTPASCPIVKRGVSTSITVNITRSTGFTGAVTLSASKLPPGTTATFSPNPATGTTSTMTVKATECPNPTKSGGYRFRVTGVNGATVRTGYYEIVVDDGPPRITAGPTSTLVAGKTMGTTSVPVQTTWAGCDASNPISYEAQRWKASVWSSAATGTTTSVSSSLTFATTYRYRARVRAVDTYSAYTYGPYFQSLLTQQSSTSVKYTGTWSSTSYTSYSGGTSKNATTAGASASYTFTGSSIAWVGAVGTSRGSANVYIDGVLKATISTYASATAYRRLLYTFNWTTQGTHTIKVVVVGTAGHPRVDLDGFVRLYRT